MILSSLLVGLTLTSTPTEAPRPECRAWVDHLTGRARRAETQRDGALADWSRDLEAYDAIVTACEKREAALGQQLRVRLVAPPIVVVDGRPGLLTATVVGSAALLLGGVGIFTGAKLTDDPIAVGGVSVGGALTGALLGLALAGMLGL